MIKINKSVIVIISLSLFLFVGYNVLTAEATESNDKKVCEEYNGKWKDIGGGDRGCTFENDDDAERYGFRPGFSLDSTSGDAEYGIEDLVSYDNEGNKVYPPNPFDETDSSKQQQEERAKMTQSKSFEKFVESKGIDIDDDYHWLSAQEQEEIETEFKEDKSDEYAEEINSKIEDEGKRYENPDGGAPLYQDELTEDEKNYYPEYKPENTPVIEDTRNTMNYEEGESKETNEQEDIAAESHDADESNDEEEEQDEEEEDEPEEDNSDSES